MYVQHIEGREHAGCVAHFVVFVSLALEGRTVLLSMTHQHLDVLWHCVKVVLWTVKLHLFPE